MSDHYDALGIGKDASEDEVKDAFRRAARKAHPDKGGTPEQFYPIQKAYEVLGDAKRRARYDRGEPDPRPDDIRIDALQEIAKIFMQAVDELDVDYDDLVGAVRGAIKDGKGKVRAARRDVERGIAKRRKALKRLGRRKDAKGDDVIAMMLKQSIAKGEESLREADRELERIDLMLQIIDEYAYSSDARETSAVYAALRIAMESTRGSGA